MTTIGFFEPIAFASESPAVSVHVGALVADATEATNRQYRVCMGRQREDGRRQHAEHEHDDADGRAAAEQDEHREPGDRDHERHDRADHRAALVAADVQVPGGYLPLVRQG